jgi:hypothetical protein
MNKKIPLAPATPREVEATRLAKLSVQPSLTMADLQGAIKEGLALIGRAAKTWRSLRRQRFCVATAPAVATE